VLLEQTSHSPPQVFVGHAQKVYGSDVSLMGRNVIYNPLEDWKLLQIVNGL